ncbi:tetratricopeptide repeat protein [Phaeodactylibacter xiamenensis]|uniref:tetratricopeptide repeat protein n=1 Tax=Phaeodactylibacter xiamenensis TaxID=1524460 RepID=UPI003CCB8F36
MGDYENYEIEEYDIELLNRGDYKGVLELRENQLRKFPNDYHIQYRWAEILTLVKEHEKAIKVLKQLHEEEPKDDDVVDLILDCLKETGKMPKDFNWQHKPEVAFLEEDIIKEVKQLLKNKRGVNRRIESVYIELLISHDHLFFNEEDFFEYLKQSSRVKLSDDKEWFDAKIKKID